LTSKLPSIIKHPFWGWSKNTTHKNGTAGAPRRAAAEGKSLLPAGGSLPQNQFEHRPFLSMIVQLKLPSCGYL
jgi:hypothetical protein